VKSARSSHFLLISPPQTDPPSALKERKCLASVLACRSQLVSLLLAAALSLCAAAPLRSNPGGQPNGGGGSDNGSPGKSGDAPGQNKPKHSRTPTARVQGDYEVRIVGYYTGSGTAAATAGGITITARVKDPAGKAMDLQSGDLTVSDDHFSGTGTLNGAAVKFDGRLDGQDRKGGEVLKRARITFTFSANGHHARGAGDKKTTGAAS